MDELVEELVRKTLLLFVSTDPTRPRVAGQVSARFRSNHRQAGFANESSANAIQTSTIHGQVLGSGKSVI
jgi:hypothetical protein